MTLETETTGATTLRSDWAGSFRREHAGSRIRVAGWVHRRRDLGGLLFVDLRDRSGLLQVSFGPDWTEPKSLAAARELGSEYVVSVEGELVVKPEPNPELATGDVELRAERLEVESVARTPEIPVYRAPDDEAPSEALRLQHRVLDLRGAAMQANLELRHRLVLAARNHMHGLGFLEIETPMLTKPTPEGARDFLVPSSVHPGEFFALPQSPQIYKQILMVSGFDRYFQIARCFRDEDLRADRQPEFTQIDVEASFVSEEDILTWMEGLMVSLSGVADLPAEAPFPRLTWRQAMERYGSDRPDLRWDLEIRDWSEALADIDFRIVRSVLEDGGRVRGLRIAGGVALSRKGIEQVEEAAKRAGAPGLMWAKRNEDGVSGPLGRFLEDRHVAAMELEVGDLVLAAAGHDAVTHPALAATRAAAIEALEIPKSREHAWLWVTEFPLFEDEGAGLAPGHHPFVLPHPDDVGLLGEDPIRARGLAYDLVYDGSELGSGSLRIHDPELQREVFRVLGLTPDEIETKFGFLLESLSRGAPPHGGIALGMDRIVQRFADAASLRDVIAFPKTTAARALFEGAPSPVRDDELAGLGLATRPSGVAS